MYFKFIRVSLLTVRSFVQLETNWLISKEMCVFFI